MLFSDLETYYVFNFYFILKRSFRKDRLNV